LRDLIQSYPEIAAVLVLVVGAGLGKLAQVLVRRVLSLSDRLVSRYGTRDRQLVSPVFQQGFSLLVLLLCLSWRRWSPYDCLISRSSPPGWMLFSPMYRVS